MAEKSHPQQSQLIRIILAAEILTKSVDKTKQKLNPPQKTQEQQSVVR